MKKYINEIIFRIIACGKKNWTLAQRNLAVDLVDQEELIEKCKI